MNEQRLLFGRAAALRIGILGGTGRDFTGLRIAFDVEKTSEPTPNKAQIRIWNLSQDSRNFLQKQGFQNGAATRPSVILEAGWGIVDPKLEVLFVGDVDRVNTERQGGDLVTTIESGDGQKAYESAKLDQSFAPATKVNSVFSALASKLGLTLGEVRGVDNSGEFLQGYSATGLVRDQLDTLTAKMGTAWSIQNGVLQVIPDGQATSEPAVVLTTKTGLVGSPQKKDEGVFFKSLLIPGLRPGRRVVLNSRFLDGIYRVQRVKISGDTRTGPWHSECEALPI